MDISSLPLNVSRNNTPRKKLWKKKARSPVKPVTLEEVIMLPKYDPKIIIFNKNQILQDLLKRKTKQEELKREY